MTTSAVEFAVRARLSSLWDQDVALIREPNTGFDPEGHPWIEIRFPGAAVDRADIGDPDHPLWNEVGAFMIDVYVPAGVGAGLASTIADAAAEIFQGREFSGVECRGRMAGQSGDRTPDGLDGRWWGVSFGIGYRYQSIAG